ncbi:hypothetical protein ACJRO7_017927 [Eucalyptus globulus]|uniref:PAZ domain-containing protein n=1 Tax=Eucalyptus globulus TaxID=34317 RepID=A0ABD3KY79_EUCGL
MIGITGGKRETGIEIGVVMERGEALSKNLFVERGVDHLLILTLVILDMMPHSIQIWTVAVQPEFNQAPEFNLVSPRNGIRFTPLDALTKVAHWLLGTSGFLSTTFPSHSILKPLIGHYNVDIKPEMPATHSHPVRLSKAALSQTKEIRTIFSAIPLPGGAYDKKIFSGEDNENSSFRCTITPHGCGDEGEPVRHMISVGRHFYPLEYHEEDDLKFGVAAFRGFQHSLNLISQGLALSLDYSVMAFPKRMPVIDFLKENIRGFSINQFVRYRREVEQVLEGVTFTVAHRRTKQKYMVVGLTNDTARSISSSCENSEGKMKKINLVNNFWEKYKIEIKYKDIPCLDFSKNKKKNFMPMEFCLLVEGRSYPKENLERDAAFMLKKLSLPPPHIRKKYICDTIRLNTDLARGNTGAMCRDVSQNFGIKVDVNMTKVAGHVIGPPELSLATLNGKVIKIEVDREIQSKDGSTLISARWTEIGLNYKLFIPKLISRCRNLGIRMEELLFYQDATMSLFSNAARLTELLEDANDRACRVGRRRPQFLLCIMYRRDIGYKNLKWICETRVGLVTQCCLSMQANKQCELFNRFPRIDGEGHVMFLGANVNHPASCNTRSLSFAAILGERASINT